MSQKNINNIYVQSLVNDLQLAQFFDSIIYSDRDKLSKVFFAEVVSLANAQNVKAYELGIKAEHIAQAMELLDSEIISGKSLKKLVPLLVQFNGDINKLLDEHQLKQIIDKNVIESILSEIISENEVTITQQLDRPERVLKMILGAAMKKTGGQISPTLSDEIAKDLLKRKFSI